MSASNELLLATGAAIGQLLHETALTQAERVFVLQLCLQSELNPPEEVGIDFQEFEKLFNETTAPS